MTGSENRIVLVLRTGKDFSYRDVELIARKINELWENGKPEIICLYDRVTAEIDLGNIKLIPLTNDYPGTWSRMQLYSPEMDKYRPFLYVDLDTAIIQSLEKIFEVVSDKFITLEDFWQPGRLATGLVWFPKDSDKVKQVWEAWDHEFGFRMDYFLRKVIKPDLFFQNLTHGICDFKPTPRKLLTELPPEAKIVCFHGKPRIHEADVEWVKNYIK